MNKIIKATIIDLIVALLIIIIVLAAINLCFGQAIGNAVQLVNQVAMRAENNSEERQAQIDTAVSTLSVYPKYGTKYATIEIPKIDVNLPVYFGNTLEILKLGVGHDSGSYFPGEGGSIIYMGHNSKNVFRRFSELQKGNEIIVTTDYGKYTYKIFDMQLVEEHEVDKLPIQRNEEILMVYTCYPFNNIGYATHRYVVYAELEK